jgi:glycine/D-amino acid oxidase-like deaminating enzyme
VTVYAVVRHTATGWWLEEAGGVERTAPPLAGDATADVVVVGGGYTGMWAAWEVLEARPGARVLLLERDVCGHGPSGRNGGFCEDLWLRLPALRARFGDAGALAVGQAAERAVSAIGEWCSSEGVDAWFRRSGYLAVSAAPAQDAVGVAAARAAAELGVGDRVVEQGRDELLARCASPRLRRGVLMPASATVQPARLAVGLRARLLARGIAVHEHTPVRRVADRGDHAEVEVAAGARVRAAHAVLAAGGALAGLGPLRGRLTVGSSHIVLTEPVPDVLDQLGWAGGEGITDGRVLLHYFRATSDGRIAFGWAGGRPAYGTRRGRRIDVDPRAVRQAATDLVRFFPALRGRRLTHAWGGPIDIAPQRLVEVGSLGSGRVHHAFGYTGNGVGPSRLAGRLLAKLALDVRDEDTRLPLVEPPPSRRVPPEPLRWAGARVVLAALARKEAAEEDGAEADPLARLIAALPGRMGITLGR